MPNNSNGVYRSGSPYMFIYDDILTILILDQRSNEILTIHFWESTFLNHSKTEFNCLYCILLIEVFKVVFFFYLFWLV